MKRQCPFKGIMSNRQAKISTELVYGIFLLTFLSISITFIASIKIIERQRIEIEAFNIQKIFYDIEKDYPLSVQKLSLYLPNGITYGIYDINKKHLISGHDGLKKEEIKIIDFQLSIEKAFLYPSITAKRVINISGVPYLMFVKKDFDAERSGLKNILFLFIPFGVVSLFTLTGFAYAYYKRRFLIPFETLKNAYSRVTEENIDVRIDRANVKEWDLIYNQFNEMIERVKNYKERLEQNIQELSKTNEALKSAQDEIIFSEKMATVGRLSAGLAHEIGNPLTSIMGYISFLRDGAKDEKDREILFLIYKETERINRIIRDLLNFARSKNEEGVGACNPKDVVVDVIRLLSPQKDFKKVELINNVLEGRAILFSAEELKQVLLNLLINAVDVSPNGGKIEISSKTEGDYFLISIKDEGGGVPLEIKDKIFDPFFTTKPVGKGTGLGLSVAHSLVTRYGGKIYFQNYEKGCIFYLKLKML